VDEDTCCAFYSPIGENGKEMDIGLIYGEQTMYRDIILAISC
jgi:hypothetical protein